MSNQSRENLMASPGPSLQLREKLMASPSPSPSHSTKADGKSQSNSKSFNKIMPSHWTIMIMHLVNKLHFIFLSEIIMIFEMIQRSERLKFILRWVISRVKIWWQVPVQVFSCVKNWWQVPDQVQVIRQKLMASPSPSPSHSTKADGKSKS